MPSFIKDERDFEFLNRICILSVIFIFGVAYLLIFIVYLCILCENAGTPFNYRQIAFTQTFKADMNKKGVVSQRLPYLNCRYDGT